VTGLLLARALQRTGEVLTVGKLYGRTSLAKFSLKVEARFSKYLGGNCLVELNRFAVVGLSLRRPVK
jgi:hypothetical protein